MREKYDFVLFRTISGSSFITPREHHNQCRVGQRPHPRLLAHHQPPSSHSPLRPKQSVLSADQSVQRPILTLYCVLWTLAFAIAFEYNSCPQTHWIVCVCVLVHISFERPLHFWRCFRHTACCPLHLQFNPRLNEQSHTHTAHTKLVDSQIVCEGCPAKQVRQRARFRPAIYRNRCMKCVCTNVVYKCPNHVWLARGVLVAAVDMSFVLQREDGQRLFVYKQHKKSISRYSTPSHDCVLSWLSSTLVRRLRRVQIRITKEHADTHTHHLVWAKKARARARFYLCCSFDTHIHIAICIHIYHHRSICVRR